MSAWFEDLVEDNRVKIRQHLDALGGLSLALTCRAEAVLRVGRPRYTSDNGRHVYTLAQQLHDLPWIWSALEQVSAWGVPDWCLYRIAIESRSVVNVQRLMDRDANHTIFRDSARFLMGMAAELNADAIVRHFLSTGYPCVKDSVATVMAIAGRHNAIETLDALLPMWHGTNMHQCMCACIYADSATGLEWFILHCANPATETTRRDYMYTSAVAQADACIRVFVLHHIVSMAQLLRYLIHFTCAALPRLDSWIIWLHEKQLAFAPELIDAQWAGLTPRQMETLWRLDPHVREPMVKLRRHYSVAFLLRMDPDAVEAIIAQQIIHNRNARGWLHRIAEDLVVVASYIDAGCDAAAAKAVLNCEAHLMKALTSLS